MTFWIPKKREYWLRKPTTPQEINLGHELADGLWLYTLNFGEERGRCLLGNALTPGTATTYGNGEEGACSEGATYGDDNAKIGIPQPPVGGWSGVSCLALYEYEAANANQYPGLISSVTSGGYYGNFLLSPDLRDGRAFTWRAGDSAAICEIRPTSIADGDLSFNMGVWDKSNLNLYGAVNGGELLLATPVPQTTDFLGASANENNLNYYSRSGGRSYVYPVYTHGIWGRAVSLGETEALKEAPYQILVDRKTYYMLGAAGGAGAALAGDAAGQATGTGALTTDIPLAGASLSVATANGAITTSIPLDGLAAAVSLASGALSAQIKLDGAAIGQALANAGLTTDILLAAAAAAQAAATGDLTTGGGAAELAGGATGVALATGDLTIQITLAGDAISQALATGALAAPGSGLSGDAAAEAGSSGLLTTQIPLAGSATAVATGSGNLSTILQLSGVAAAASNAAGGLTASITLNGAALAQALAGGDLTTVAGGANLAGDALVQALAGGSLTTQIPLDGDAVGVAVAAGNLTTGAIDIPTIPRWTVAAEKRNWTVRDERSWRVCA